MKFDRVSEAQGASDGRQRERSASVESTELNAGWIVAFIVAVACHLMWQSHGIASGHFQNLDVAGIVYNARLLLAGRLPYVDSVEIKPPGAFLLVAPWLALAGLKGVWWFSVFWGAMTSLATGWLGALCWGAQWGPRIAILHAAGAAVAADGDINYSFWMTLPLVLSAVFVARAALSPRLERAVLSWAAAAAMGTFAVLVRPSAVTAVIVYGAAMAALAWQKSWRALLGSLLAGIAGIVVVAALVALPFIHGGSLQAMVHGYSSVRHYADESVTAIVVGAGGRLPATLNGLQCLPDQLPVFHLLLAVALLPASSSVRRKSVHPTGFLAWIFALAALVGISLTLRFFTHDNAPLWAALAVLVMRPTSLIGVAVDCCARYRYVELAVSLGIGILAPWSNWQSLTWMQNRMHQSDAQVARVCERVGPYLARNETVLAWGWTAWGVYEHCGRWAPGSVYKDLTTVTTPNTNTCNRGYDPPRLKNGRLADRFLRDLRQKPPGLIVLSDYYRGLGSDPLDEWLEARRFIGDNYVVYESFGGFRALLRRDLGASTGLLRDRRPAFAVPADKTAMASVAQDVVAE